jgi:hypothetical protein
MAKLNPSQKKLRGNASRKGKIEDEVEVPVVVKPDNLSDAEEVYWDLWAPYVEAAGKLTMMTRPSFLNLIRVQARLDAVNKTLNRSDIPLMNRVRYMDVNKKVCTVERESAYSKLSRDLSNLVNALGKPWGVTADSVMFKPVKKKSKAETFLEDE